MIVLTDTEWAGLASLVAVIAPLVLVALIITASGKGGPRNGR